MGLERGVVRKWATVRVIVSVGVVLWARVIGLGFRLGL